MTKENHKVEKDLQIYERKLEKKVEINEICNEA